MSLCRALVHKPGLLLMDEPFGALDALTREQLQRDLERMWLVEKRARGADLLNNPQLQAYAKEVRSVLLPQEADADAVLTMKG